MYALLGWFEFFGLHVMREKLFLRVLDLPWRVRVDRPPLSVFRRDLTRRLRVRPTNVRVRERVFFRDGFALDLDFAMHRICPRCIIYINTSIYFDQLFWQNLCMSLLGCKMSMCTS